MTTWTRRALAGAAPALLAGLICFRLAAGPHKQASAEAAGPSCADMARLVRERLPALSVVAERANGDLGGGLYLCESPRTWADLNALPKEERAAGAWAGVVSCEHIDPNGVGPPADCEDWGDNGLEVGQFLFFGDARLIARLRATLA